MRFARTTLAATAVMLLSAPALAAPAAPKATPAKAIAAVVADLSRPAPDKAADAERKPAAMLAFAGVKKGMHVFELIPGRGYFTRLFSIAVGPQGGVTGYVAEESIAMKSKPLDSLLAIGNEPGRGNVHAAHYPLMAPPPAELAGTFDVVWTSQNYHDFHNAPGFDATSFNRNVLALLKPGGVYVVLDHSALPGADVTKTLHRIDEAAVQREAEAAGFVFDGKSGALSNPADPRTAAVFDPSIRGHTDQFVLRFRKPG